MEVVMGKIKSAQLVQICQGFTYFPGESPAMKIQANHPPLGHGGVIACDSNPRATFTVRKNPQPSTGEPTHLRKPFSAVKSLELQDGFWLLVI
ncbi:hypothetical protein NL676_015957 [Syzygium grande]|nr:hypothetical protein NL676_015957 [Syzygium grande]